MSNKTDVVSCHYQSEYQNSRFRVAGATVQNLSALVEQTHRSEPTSSPQSQNYHTVNMTISNNSLDNIALIF